MSQEFHLVIVLLAFLAAVAGITYLGEKKMSKADVLAAAFNRLAAAIDRALAASTSSTPDDAVQAVVGQANATADKIDATFPPPTP